MAATQGGLEAASGYRLRGAFPHLLYSIASIIRATGRIRGTREADTLGSCGYVYLAVYPAQTPATTS
ncbi:antitoxin of toxin-antitoxin stability system [Escherichia coli]|nr:antitoxin of toxin-antitoxin stability system [Escherichia coli]HAJ5058558.1 antitoxin of toxin-antitoxin stability system [Escherichia coli]